MKKNVEAAALLPPGGNPLGDQRQETGNPPIPPGPADRGLGARAHSSAADARQEIWIVVPLELPPAKSERKGILVPPTPLSESPLAMRVRASFQQQTVMAVIGASLRSVAPGAVEIELPYRADLCQQDGFLHAGIVTTILDSACGYAAYTLMPNDARVLSVEFKINFLAPAVGERFLARGRVARAGRTVTVCTGEVAAVAQDSERAVALMQATMMAVLP